MDTVVDPDTEVREATEVAREVMEDRADMEVAREEVTNDVIIQTNCKAPEF